MRDSGGVEDGEGLVSKWAVQERVPFLDDGRLDSNVPSFGEVGWNVRVW